MDYYDLLFLGMIKLSQRTRYNDVAEYLAAMGMAAVIEIHFVIFMAIVFPHSYFLKPYSLIPLYIILFFLNNRYHAKRQKKFSMVEASHDKKSPNLSFSEGLALFFITESALLPIVLAAIKDSTQ